MAEKTNILIVEDDKSWQENYRDILEANYTLHIVGTRNDALEIIARQFFHAAVVDLRLKDDVPGNEDGLEVAAQLHKLGEGTTV